MSRTARPAYTVRGSEDGLLAVYSSARKATRHAIGYVRESWGTGDPEIYNFDGPNPPATVAEVAKRLREEGWCTVRSGRVEAEVQAFDLSAPVPQMYR